MHSSLAAAAAPTLLWGPAHPRSGTSALPPFDYAKADDRELASLSTQGREATFRELLSHYQRPVFSLVYRMVRDRTLAEDLAQETFIRGFNAIASYDPAYRFSNWIFRSPTTTRSITSAAASWTRYRSMARPTRPTPAKSSARA